MAFTSGSPNQGMLQIGIALTLQDRFSQQARESSKEIRRLHQDAKNLTNANLSAVNQLATAGAGIGMAATYGIFGAVQQGARFIDTMTFVKAIAKDTGTDFELLAKRAKTLGKDTMFTSQDIGSAMQYMAMAGQGTTEIFNNITAAADLANSTMSELGGKGGAADIMTNIMKMFTIDSTQQNSTRVADVLTRAVTRSNTNLYDLAEAIKYAGTTTTNLGATLEQTSAAIGVLGDAGIQGSMAGTALSNAYRYLSKSIGDPNFKGGKALKKLGLGKSDFIDAQGDLIDLGLAMQKIANASSGLGSLDQYNLLVNILGVRGERAGSTMIRAFQNYTKLLDEINNNSKGAASDIREQRMASLAGALETVSSTWENMVTSFTQSIAPVLTPWLRGLGKILEGVQAILDSPIGPFIATLMTGATVLGTISLSVIALKTSMKLLFNDSTVSLRSMFAVMMQGWKGAQMSASQYAVTERAIIAQRQAGMAGAGVGNAVLWHGAFQQKPGQYIGSLMGKQDKKGNWRYYHKDQQTGGVRGIKPEVANRYMQRFGPTAVIGAGAGVSGAMRFGATSVMKGALSFFGGPWGLLATTVIMFLPQIVSWLSRLFDSSETGNATLKSLTPEEQRKKNIEEAAVSPQEREIINQKMLLQQQVLLEKVAAQLAQQNMQGPIKGNNLINDIYMIVDGRTFKPAFQVMQMDQLINAGGK